MNEIEREDGLNLPCFNCRNIKKCHIITNCFNNEKLKKNNPNIKCISCGTIISNTINKNHEHYNIIYEKILKNINRRYQDLIYELKCYRFYNEIYNLSIDKKKLIIDLIRIFLYNHINIYGEKRIIKIQYILVKIFELLGINLEVTFNFPITYRDEAYFHTIIKYSFDDIFYIIKKFH